MAYYQRKHYRKRSRLRFGRLYWILSIIVILAAMFIGSIVFFRIDQVEVEGNSRYSAEEIIEASGIEYGKNMFLFNKFDSIDTILTDLTYVESVSIRRSLPSTLRITVTESSVAAAVEDQGDGQWWLINADGKLLERAEGPGAYVQVVGLTLAAPTEGTVLAAETEGRLQQEALLRLLPAMEERELLADTQTIDLSSASEVTMLYENRLTVKMSLAADFDYDMRVLATVLEEYVDTKWTETDRGTLDLTNEDGQPHLIKTAA